MGEHLLGELTVGAAAELVGVSVRTLHHWDAVGLVHPSGRTAAGYRVYSDADVARLHRVLVYCEVGFDLARIGDLLDRPVIDARGHLERQRELLVERISRLREKVSAVDRMLQEDTVNAPLTPAQRAEIFGRDWNPEYQAEAEERWGDTPQWEQSQQRAAGLDADAWRGIRDRGERLESELGDAARAGLDPGSPEAAALVVRHREMIGEFYDCTPSMQVCLTRMYRSDERFREHYERIEPGLTEWLAAAVAAEARTHGVDPETATWS